MNLFSLAGWTWVWETINSLLLIICDWIYICIGWFYQVFTAVAKTNLFSREVFDKITSRLYIIVAMAMLFIFAYNIILMIIDPDKKQTTGNAGKLVKDTIISFVLVILLPTIFNYMYVFQNNVIESNVIQTIILGEDLGGTSGKSTNCDKDDFDCSCDFSGLRGLTDYTQKKRNAWLTAGKYILTGGLYGLVDIYSAFHNSNDDAAIFKALGDSCQLYRDDLTGAQRGAYSVGPTLLAAFYRPSSFTYEECVDYLLGNDSTPVDTDEEKDVCVNYFIDINMSRYTGNIGMFVGDQELIRVVSDSSKDIIEFNGFMALLAGGLAAWMFLCYAMEIGVRVAKLGVLQLISPIPVMMRIVPGKKESMFDKWLHQLINTYLDVFIRLIIIFFSLFAISLVPDVLDTLWASLGSSSNNAFIRILAGVVVILGILKFGQDAPGLLKEFFGGLGGGTFALRSPAKQISDNKLAMGGLGMIGGAASGAVKNIGKGSTVGGAVSGAFRGARAGYKSQNFKDLKYNTSAAVDRVLQARDERDIRQAYDKEHFPGAYRAMGLKNSFDKWIAGDSFASLTAKKAKLESLEGNYNKAIADVEKAIEEKATRFKYDGKSYYEYKQMQERAAKEYQGFDRQKYEENYMKSGATIEQAREASQNELNRLLEASNKQTQLLADVKKNLTDGILQNINAIDDNFDKIHNFIDGDGGNHVINIGDEMKGLKETIDKANNAFEKNSESLSSDLNKVLSDDDKSVRAKRGALRGEMSKLDAKIASLSELKQSDKK